MKLSYSKDCHSSVMMDMLSLNILSNDFNHINISEYKQGKDNIIIYLKRSFFSNEVDEITTIIESYTSDHMMVKRKALEDHISIPGMIAGQNIMAKYSAMNMAKNKSFTNYLEIFEITKTLTNYLLSGSLEMAKYELMQIKGNLPDSGSIDMDECDEFIRRLDIEIKRLKG